MSDLQAQDTKNHPHISNLNSHEITKQSHHNKSSAQRNIETFVH